MLPNPKTATSTKQNELGSYYCYNRTYDTKTGGWTTPDPARSPWSNLQDYVGTNALGRTDRTGLKTWFLIGAGQDGSNGVYKGIFEGADDTERDNLSFVKESWRRMGLVSFGSKWKAASLVDSADWRSWAHKVGSEICAAKAKNEDEPIRLIGYSRGAALVLVVAKFLETCGCNGASPNWNESGGPRFGNTYPCKVEPCPELSYPKIKFMGLVDAVSSSGKWPIAKDPYVPDEVPSNVLKAVVYRGIAWVAEDKGVMKFHNVKIEPPRVRYRAYKRKHAGTEDNSNSMGARDATDVLRDLEADYE